MMDEDDYAQHQTTREERAHREAAQRQWDQEARREQRKKSQVDSNSTQAGEVVVDGLTPVRLDKLFAQDFPPAEYRIDRVWPMGGRILLAAQFKAGKTTLGANLLRSLADGAPFLDEFKVSQPEGRIVLLDNEMDVRQSQRWLRDVGIQHPERIEVVHLRGQLSKFELMDEEWREEYAKVLRGTEILILDCLRPLIDIFGLDENRDAGKVLTAFDELLGLAGISEGLVIHHMGHSNERSRGDSRLRDWPDAEWKLTRAKGTDGENDPRKPRYFSAFGRDVDVAEAQLTYDHTVRRLRFEGGSREEVRVDSALTRIVAYLSGQNVPLATERIVNGLMGKVPRDDVRDALKSDAAKNELIITKQGNATKFAVREYPS